MLTLVQLLDGVELALKAFNKAIALVLVLFLLFWIAARPKRRSDLVLLCPRLVRAVGRLAVFGRRLRSAREDHHSYGQRAGTDDAEVAKR